MGKIRIKTFGDKDQEKKEEEKRKREREQKKLAKVSGLKGGQKVTAVGPTEEELLKQEEKKPEEEKKEEEKKTKKTKKTKPEKQPKSKNYLAKASLIKKNQLYPLDKALEILKSMRTAAFDETVELHISTKEKGISGQVVLPHGTGKKVRVKVADASSIDNVISQIEKGQIDFDFLVATPTIMAKLAKVARILGPKGLMPNPKNGTISDNPEKVVEKLTAGQINFKTEQDFPLIHLVVGKKSFDNKQIEENIKAITTAIGSAKIKSLVMKLTMSPSIRVDPAFFIIKKSSPHQ